MSWLTLGHVATGDLATAALHNSLLDDLAVVKTEVGDLGIVQRAQSFRGMREQRREQVDEAHGRHGERQQVPGETVLVHGEWKT